jgi:hypothetical protein
MMSMDTIMTMNTASDENNDYLSGQYHCHGSASASEAVADCIALAYSQYTEGSQSIATKWGHFDAMDAGRF